MYLDFSSTDALEARDCSYEMSIIMLARCLVYEYSTYMDGG